MWLQIPNQPNWGEETYLHEMVLNNRMKIQQCKIMWSCCGASGMDLENFKEDWGRILKEI